MSADHEEARRSYWAAQMDAAYRFMLDAQARPVEECGEPLASLRDAVRAAGVEVLFSPLPHARGLPRRFLLREGLMADFLAAAREMNDRGWVLQVEDAYRTREMQKLLALRPDLFSLVLRRVQWELGGREPDLDLLRRRLAALIAMSPRVGTHCAGSAVDVTVLARDDGAEIDRGAPYLEISERTPMDSPFVGEEAAANRSEITALMARHGFRSYPFEFWHYNKGDAYDALLSGGGQPARYGAVDVDPVTGMVTAIEDAARPLNTETELLDLIQSVRGG